MYCLLQRFVGGLRREYMFLEAVFVRHPYEGVYLCLFHCGIGPKATDDFLGPQLKGGLVGIHQFHLAKRVYLTSREA